MSFYATYPIFPAAVLILGGIIVSIFERAFRGDNGMMDMFPAACVSLFAIWYFGFYAAQQAGQDLLNHINPLQWVP